MRHMYIRLPRAGRATGRIPAGLELAEVHVCQVRLYAIQAA